MSDELKPCRFCNGPAVPVKQFKDNVTCGNKHCPGCIVIQEPAKWNSRPIEDALRSKLAVAVEALEECRRFCNEFDYEPTYNDIENIEKALAKIRS